MSDRYWGIDAVRGDFIYRSLPDDSLWSWYLLEAIAGGNMFQSASMVANAR